uniref:Predicted protein n=1 Tax=Hordeum vulgare subsp. vulgare TaxID=112509 RepID=F2DCP2_HORVV|nr:predicted protein [Hordeum vulgare subsp. vulgare]
MDRVHCSSAGDEEQLHEGRVQWRRAIEGSRRGCTAMPCAGWHGCVCRRPDSPEVATPSMAARGAAALRVSRCVRVSRATVRTPAWLLTSDGDDCPHGGDEGEAMQEINATAWCERGTCRKADGRSV